MSKSFEELISKANQKTLKKVSVSNAQDEPVLQAVKAAKEQNIATAILVGDEAKIREIAASIDMDLTDFEIINEPDTEAAALKAVELVHNGKADILLKGLLETKTFLKSVLNKGVGLRTGKMLSHVCVFEIEGINRLLFFTDVAFNTYPTLATVNPKMQPTVDADNLTKMYESGDFKGCQIYGPLSMDLAIDPEAAVHKGVTNPVAGHADILLFPNIDAGNITYKILVRTAKVKIGNVLVGTSAPVVLTSRSDDFQTKLNSIALATVIAGSITD